MRVVLSVNRFFPVLAPMCGGGAMFESFMTESGQILTQRGSHPQEQQTAQITTWAATPMSLFSHNGQVPARGLRGPMNHDARTSVPQLINLVECGVPLWNKILER